MRKASKKAHRVSAKKKLSAASSGSTLDQMLAEDGLYDVANAEAIKRVVAWQVEQAIANDGISKVEMARRMKTSRAALDRLLDPDNASVTLQTLSKVALALGKRLRVELVDPAA
jgi:antitoxin HicB